MTRYFAALVLLKVLSDVPEEDDSERSLLDVLLEEIMQDMHQTNAPRELVTTMLKDVHKGIFSYGIADVTPESRKLRWEVMDAMDWEFFTDVVQDCAEMYRNPEKAALYASFRHLITSDSMAEAAKLWTMLKGEG